MTTENAQKKPHLSVVGAGVFIRQGGCRTLLDVVGADVFLDGDRQR